MTVVLYCLTVGCKIPLREKSFSFSSLLVISAAVLGTSAYIARRRISRKWIDYRSVEHDLNGKVFVVTGGNTGAYVLMMMCKIAKEG